MTNSMENSIKKQNIKDKELERRISIIKEYLNQMENYGFSGTVLLSINGNIHLHEGYGYMDYERQLPMSKNAIMSIGSISKQFTSTIILLLQEKGLLHVNNNLDQFFEDVPDHMKEITVHQLLTHTAGLLEGLGDDFTEISSDEILRLLWQTELTHTPGSKFKYSNIGYSVAAIIAQKVAGKSYLELLRDLYQYLGITTASWFGDPKYNNKNSVSYYVDGERRGSVYEWKGSWDPKHTYWHILGNGGITISQYDMYIYLSALFQGDIISGENLKLLLTPELENYAYGWDISQSPLGKLIQHNGGSSEGVSSVAKYYENYNLILTISTNSIINGFGLAFAVEEKLEKILYGEEITMPKVVKSTNMGSKISEGDYNLKGFESSGLVNLRKLKNGPSIIGINGQYILDTILETDRQLVPVYAQMNHIVQKFGNLILQKQWKEAFQLTKRKDNYKARAELLIEIIEFFEKKHGKVQGIEVGGTLPFPEYYAMTLLLFVGKEGEKAGIPIIWENNEEILGFRPLLSEYTATLFVSISDNIICCYSPQIDKPIIFKYDSDEKNLEIVD